MSESEGKELVRDERDGTAKSRSLSRADFLKIATGAAGLTAGVVGIAIGNPQAARAQKGGGKTKVDTPTIECAGFPSNVSLDINVCAPGGAGATGLPAGFSLQWITKTAYENGPDGIPGTGDDNSWPASDSAALCKAGFSGNANDSRYVVAAGTCVTVRVGDLLLDNGASTSCPDDLVPCTEYVFRAFGHATSQLHRSDFSNNTLCKTTGCDADQCPPEDCCTLTQGYWKNHFPVQDGCAFAPKQATPWPVNSLTLGTISYSICELIRIFNQPTAGNGLIALAHQLIAAKLNVAANSACATDQAILDAIAAADALIGNKVVPPIGTGSLRTSATSSLVTTLNNYNVGITGPGHCCED